mgnify:FL=1
MQVQPKVLSDHFATLSSMLLPKTYSVKIFHTFRYVKCFLVFCAFQRCFLGYSPLWKQLYIVPCFGFSFFHFPFTWKPHIRRSVRVLRVHGLQVDDAEVIVQSPVVIASVEKEALVVHLKRPLAVALALNSQLQRLLLIGDSSGLFVISLLSPSPCTVDLSVQLCKFESCVFLSIYTNMYI